MSALLPVHPFPSLQHDPAIPAAGLHHAPAGLYAHSKAQPFIGRVTCHTTAVEAGSWQEIILDFEVGASGVADGACIKATFKFYSDWALFQTSDPTGANFISAEYQAGPLLPGQSPASVQSLAVRFDQKGHERPYQKAVIVDVVDGYLNAGDHIIIRLGDRRRGGPGTRVQTFVEDAFHVRFYVDPLGTSRFVAVPDDVVLRVAHGPASQLFLNAPRYAQPGQPLPLRVSALDRWGNIVRDWLQPLQVRVLQAGAPVQEVNLAFAADGWASTGLAGEQALRLPEGRYEIEAQLSGAPQVPPARFAVDVSAAFPTARPFYADLHVHAHDTVGTNSPGYNAAYAREIGGVDIFGYTANDFQITDHNWRVGLEAVQAANVPGEFVAYAVQEWCGSSTAGGDHNVVFLGDATPGFPHNERGEHNRTFVWNEDMKGTGVSLGRWPVQELWAAYADDAENHLVMPHVGGRRYIPDWHHPGLERLVEIASTWGHFGWLYQDVIRRGYQLGVAASSDEHRGRPGGGAPGVQVFGVHGGLTGVLADWLDRASVGRALRARHTWATTGEHAAVITRVGPHRQGDAFDWQGEAPVQYQFLGQSGWEYLAAYDHTGRIWERDLHRELGYSERRIRLRWGGARIPDRYRWAAWQGRIQVLGGTVLGFRSHGFEHAEESAWRAGPTELGFRSDTYGDADSIEIEVSQLADLRIVVSGTIDSFIKVGDPLQRNPFVHRPDFHWEVSGAELVQAGRLQLDLGGTELFVALERLTDVPLPQSVEGVVPVSPDNAAFGFRPVYFHGRQRDDSKAWSSAHFIHFT
ncbi:hypothetical protein [Acidovorax radicis]|uniref:hypothetical protein n=1 Tax=Acidovorax radicis TaxID=758826 RepID=UPI00023769F3|nr:hypothetical protein [Acidovorax radicis]